jgi:hypothetical protein
MHDAADDAAIVHPLDAPDIPRQLRFDPLPLLIVQPKQVPAHDPNPLPKTNQDRIVRAEKLMSSDPNYKTLAKELVDLRPDAILGQTTLATSALRESDRHLHVVAALRYLVDESVERDQDLLDSGLGVVQLIHGGLLTLYPTPAKHRLRRFGSMKMTDRDSDTLDRIGCAMMKAWSRVKRPKRKEWSDHRRGPARRSSLGNAGR